MFGHFRRKLSVTLLSLRRRTHCLKKTQFVNSITAPNPLSCPYRINIFIKQPLSSVIYTTFCSYTYVKPGDESEAEEKSETSDGDDVDKKNSFTNKGFAQKDVHTILDILNDQNTTKLEAKKKLEECRSVTISSDLVIFVLSRMRNDWEKAFTFFVWAQKKPHYMHSLRAYHSMISILAKMRKFDTAWALINEMRGDGTRESLVTPHTLLIMIRRYCSMHEVAKAINTFYVHKLFKFDLGMGEFHSLLSALCRYKNVKDAENLLFCNEKVFAFNTKSFNIILNGWCNVVGNPWEAKRIWREMEEREITRDVISYSSIISCFSKYGNLHEALKLFNQMKELNIESDRKVYNAVIHALAKKRLVKEACDLLKTMEESGISPNAVSYNSLIMPLCKSGKLNEARYVFDKMLEGGVSPSDRTFQAFFRIMRSKDQVFSLLEKMNEMGLCPNNDTYIMLIRKFSRWGKLDEVFNLWSEMRKHGGPDRSAYIALVHGLFLNGKLQEACKYYEEMKEKNYLPKTELDKLLQSCSAKRDCKGVDDKS